MQKTEFPKLFYTSAIDWKDDLEEKFDRARGSLTRILGVNSALSERESHDILSAAACRDQRTHDEISIALLYNVLTAPEPQIASKNFRDLNLLARDNLSVVAEQLNIIIIDKYIKLTDVSRSQTVWVVKEMVKADIPKADMLCWSLLRQVAGGDVSNRNLWLAETVLDLIAENRSWLKKYPVLIASVIYTYLRILEDHFSPVLTSLRQKEATIVASLIREHFNDVCMNAQIGLGRDLVRLIQSVARIPEIESIYRDLSYHPKTLSPFFTGIEQLLNIRTSRKFLQSRLTPDMEKKVSFLSFQVRFGLQKRYQDWFQRQFLSTPESQTLRADIIRFIVGVVHPPNEILCSDILPRWAVIGWLLSTCTNPVANANAKLALFYDWLFFDPFKDNIMNIEPGILVMFHSLRTHVTITATLLDFLIKLTYEYWVEGADKVKDSVGAAFRSIVDKKVLPNLDPLLANQRLDADLRASIQEKLIVLLDRGNNGGGGGGNGNNNNNKTVEIVILEGGDGYRSNPSQEMVLMSGGGYAPTNSNGTSSSSTLSSPSKLTNNNSSSNKASKTLSKSAKSHPERGGYAELSDEDDGDDDSDTDSDDEKIIQTPSSGLSNIPMRNSPTLGSSVEEAEKTKIFEIIQNLPSKLRLSLQELAEGQSLVSRSEQVQDIIAEDLAEPNIDPDLRDRVLKCLMYIFKSDLTKPCVNEDSRSIIENLTISPVMEILNVLQDLKVSEKQAKRKNLNTLLAEIIKYHPGIGYKLIIMLHNLTENSGVRPSPSGGGKPTDHKQTMRILYKNLTVARGLKLEAALGIDLKCCWERDPHAVGYLAPIIYQWFGPEIIDSPDILYLVVSTVDPGQLQEIIWRVMQGDIMFFDVNVVPLICKTLDWDSWEQSCVWNLLAAHDIPIDDLLPLIPQLDVRLHPEAMSGLLMRLKQEKPNTDILGPLLCRKPSQKDRFLLTLLHYWSEEDEEGLSDLLATLLVKASGSPVKRKRGVNAGRGNSPAGPSIPTVDNVLAHLEHFRKFTLLKDGKVLTRDAMQAAFLQVQCWVTETQRSKFRELLALAAQEEPEKETTSKETSSSSSRTSSKRSTTNSGGLGTGLPPASSSSTPRKIPGSPTSSSNTSSGVATGSTSPGSLSRTRSGKTRKPINLKEDSTEESSSSEDEEEEEEEDEEDVDYRKIKTNPRKRRKIKDDSDSD